MCATVPTTPSTVTSLALTFSTWMMIEECLDPPLAWERERGWSTLELSEPEASELPEGTGPYECANVEH